MLAGISSDYYLRLEQGRDKNPSAQILDALARALQLDIKGTEYLHQLTSGSRSEQPGLQTAADGLGELIDQFPMPTIVASRYQDVLAANPIACALSPGFAPGQNFLRWRLVDPAAREFFVDWDEATDVAVSGLREVAASDSDDPRMRALIDELSAASPRFRELWARTDGLPGGDHPHASSPRRRPLSSPQQAVRSPLGWSAPDHLSRRARQPIGKSLGGTATSLAAVHRCSPPRWLVSAPTTPYDSSRAGKRRSSANGVGCALYRFLEHPEMLRAARAYRKADGEPGGLVVGEAALRPHVLDDQLDRMTSS